MSDTTPAVNPATVRPGEARYDTEGHEHHWIQGNNILGHPFAECLCGATAEWDNTPTREEVELALHATGYAARDVLDAVARLWLEATTNSGLVTTGLVVDEAMIERAADELRIIDDEWDSMSPMTMRGMAERVLRAALEVSDEQ